jgi:SAM-dependent methyltransferase
MDSQAVDADAFDRFEAASWDQRAAGYERFFVSLTTQTIGPLLDAAGVGPGTRVLDLASGPGHVAAACAARGASVTGVDIAAEMVALASRRHPEIRFERADAQQLPFPDGSADAVVGNFAILHVGRPERVAGEAARVLAPGGTLALSTWDDPLRCRLLKVFTDAIGEVGAVPPPDLPDGHAGRTRPAGFREDCFGSAAVTRTLLALLIAVAAAAVAAVVYLIAAPDNDSAGNSVAASVPPSPPPTGSSPAAAPPPTADQTQAFHDFAMVGRTYPQEWLVRTKRVYWTETGALWATATMPANPRERTTTIESICQMLSDYVTTVAKRDWHGVSVRTVDGAELITRANPTDTCRPAG